MVLDRFLSWVAAAPSAARADAARALIAAYSRPEADRLHRQHLDHMVAVLLDDEAVVVRRALSDASAASIDVPRHVVVALSRDCSAVSTAVLGLSTLLTTVDLVEAVAVGDAAVHAVIAARADVPAHLATTLAQVADLTTALVLCRNPGAALTPAALRLLADRFGTDGEVRDALLARDDLGPELRHDLAVALARVLTTFAVSCAWMSEGRARSVVRESSEKAIVVIADGTARARGAGAVQPLVAYLRRRADLTPAVLLRALISGATALFDAALADLAGLSPAHIGGLTRAPFSLAFASLYRRAALPPPLLPAFRSALQAAQQRRTMVGWRDADLCLDIIDRVRTACCAPATPSHGLSALLDRFEAESLREQMRSRRRARLEPRPPGSLDLSVRVEPTLRAPILLAA